MYENPQFNENREKILCEMNGRNADMLMDIKVKLLKKGESVSFCDEKNETAVLLIAGEVEYAFDGKTENAVRRTQFTDKPYCLHFSKGKTAVVTAKADSKILIQQTDNGKDFGYVWYTPENVILQEFGKSQWDGTAHRQVLTLFDYENAPYSNMVLGEVIHKPGCWSSYPPHYHPQPEVYYYEFDKPQGFGVGFNGDDCYKVENEGVLCITPMKTHQQVAAPGYSMCYVWMIRHLDGDPWRKTRIDAPEHKWLLDI
ncbi:MAG: 5-deoxy-glucuronate isomerase [Oscillospiraceae bacterium]|nr:5-deoxy-glucuronate isomerase [Oscillospiraceae bacterium]